MYHFLEELFITCAHYGEVALEYVGMFIILYSAARCVYMLVTKSPRARLVLGEGIALALGFLLAGEVLATAVAKDLSELVMVIAIMGLRAAMTLLIHWEIKNEEHQLKELQEELEMDTERVASRQIKG